MLVSRTTGIIAVLAFCSLTAGFAEAGVTYGFKCIAITKAATLPLESAVVR